MHTLFDKLTSKKINNDTIKDKNMQLVDIIIEPYLPTYLPKNPAINAPIMGKNITSKYMFLSFYSANIINGNYTAQFVINY